jgi:Zn-dependent M28 family amino/carboxypeptidase
MPHVTPLAILTLITLLLEAPSQRDQGKPTGLVEDVAKLASSSTNEARFDVLTGLLTARNLTFTIEPVTIEKPIGAEPRTEGRNIVVAVGTGTEEIVVGAHYDAARLPDGSLSRGAVDNAASSVILVRLADTLRGETLPVRVKVKIVWFDMEELGLIGSAQYVQEHASDRIAAMLNFDINASGNTVVFGPSERKENAGLRRTLVQTCAAEEAACVGFPQMPPGDDRPFVKAGVPSVSIGTVAAIEAHQLWLIMNAGPNAGLAPGTAPATLRTIHTAEDTIEKVNEETMARMLRFALSLVRSVARS